MSAIDLQAQTLLFDLDGTLVNSWPLLEPIYIEWAMQRKLDPTTVLRAIAGARTLDALTYILGSHRAAVRETRRLERQEWNAAAQMQPMCGADSILRALPADRWGIVTSSSRRNALSKLHSCELPVPSTLITAEDVTVGKPDPEGYLAAAHWLNIKPSEIIVFEDSAGGVEAALAAGATTIAVCTPPLRNRAPLHVNTLNDVTAYCEASGIHIRLRVRREEDRCANGTC